MRVPGIVAVSVCAFVGSACGASGAVGSETQDFSGAPLLSLTSRGGAYSVAVRLSPSSPARGEQSVEYAVTDATTGQPATGLTVTVVPWMPAMGHGTSQVPSVSETSPGVYVATDVAWFMPGQWILRTTLSAGAAPADDGAGAVADADAGDDSGAVAGSAASDYVEPSFEIP